ncbi:helix-turn-helix domain-containing protein [Gallaecimonas sp. GXIMD4217]|uniref:AraC family transcriptional regulator n=1 Tax=Gallaecimonas sp. GXIMD4217 TaxID=3131927 RepID=UPI00311B3ABA
MTRHRHWQQLLPGYQERLPGPALAGWVERYCRLQGSADTGQPLHPEGGCGLLFNFGDPILIDGAVLASPGIVSGPALRTQELAPVGRFDLLSVRFLPGRAWPFLGPLDALAGMTLTPGQWHCPLALSELGERMSGQAFDAQVALLEAALAQCLMEADGGSIGQALALIQSARGQLSISTLAEQLGAGRRRLERQFKAQLGLSPKQYSRLQRVKGARRLLRSRGEHGLADTAYQAGYWDQAHFIRDFKAVLGLTPGQYLAHLKRRYGN